MKATAANIGGALGFIEATVPPGRGSTPHAHSSETEAFYLLSGELDFLDGDQRFTARQGDFVLVPPGIRHSFTNRAVHTARMVFMYSPADAAEESAATDRTDQLRRSGGMRWPRATPMCRRDRVSHHQRTRSRLCSLRARIARTARGRT